MSCIEFSPTCKTLWCVYLFSKLLTVCADYIIVFVTTSKFSHHYCFILCIGGILWIWFSNTAIMLLLALKMTNPIFYLFHKARKIAFLKLLIGLFILEGRSLPLPVLDKEKGLLSMLAICNEYVTSPITRKCHQCSKFLFFYIALD